MVIFVILIHIKSFKINPDSMIIFLTPSPLVMHQCLIISGPILAHYGIFTQMSVQTNVCKVLPVVRDSWGITGVHLVFICLTIYQFSMGRIHTNCGHFKLLKHHYTNTTRFSCTIFLQRDTLNGSPSAAVGGH